VKAEKHP